MTEILSATGRVVTVPERYQDAVTAISGSGPAYLFFVVEAMIESGVHLGLPRDISTELVVQTMLGSATMLRETGEHPTVLRERVTSPGGTTAAAVKVLEDHKVRAAFLGAMEAARDRSRSLAEGARAARFVRVESRRCRRSRPGRRAMTGRLVYSEELTRYDFGHDHAMGPGRVRHTIELAEQLGVLDLLEIVPPPPIDDDLILAVHDRDYVDAVKANVENLAYGLGSTDNPIFSQMHEVSATIAMATAEAARGVWAGEVRRACNISGGLHHAMPRADQRLLRLQRPRRGHQLAAGERRRADRVRGRRRAPRRRGAADLLQRSAGADGQPARDPGGAVPGHRLPVRDRRAGRDRLGGQRGVAARGPGTAVGCAPSTRWCRRRCGPSSRRS